MIEIKDKRKCSGCTACHSVCPKRCITMEMDEEGYLLTDEHLCTGVPGVFAAGDVRRKQLRQIVTAAADGALAGIQACQFRAGLL